MFFRRTAQIRPSRERKRFGFYTNLYRYEEVKSDKVVITVNYEGYDAEDGSFVTQALMFIDEFIFHDWVLAMYVRPRRPWHWIFSFWRGHSFKARLERARRSIEKKAIKTAIESNLVKDEREQVLAEYRETETYGR